MSIGTKRFKALLLGFWLLIGPVAAFAEEQRYPDVLDVQVTEHNARWTVSATLSSPYDTADRYADAFRILTEDNVELGVRTLWHDHANEQPFTRSLVGVSIPPTVKSIVVQGRDQRHGWGGQVVRISLSDGMTEILPSWPKKP